MHSYGSKRFSHKLLNHRDNFIERDFKLLIALTCLFKNNTTYLLNNEVNSNLQWILAGIGGLKNSSACAKFYLNDIQNFHDAHMKWEVFKMMRLEEDAS
jgi:hypothetical protein